VKDEVKSAFENPDFFKVFINSFTKRYPGLKEDVKALFEKIDAIDRERKNK